MSRAVPAGFFVLRTPRLALAPIDQLRERVREPDVRDALAAASPTLVEAAAADGAGLRVHLALTRYLARMSGRSTPRGLLAAVSTGSLGASARLRLGRTRPVSRLSTPAAAAVAAALERDRALRPLIPYRPNPWRYEAGAGRLRYIENRGGGRHALVGAAATSELLATLDRARDGATLGQLVDALVRDGADCDDARQFVEELAEAQLLLPDLAVVAHGAQAGTHLQARLRELAPATERLRDVEDLLAAVAAADAAPPGERQAALGAAQAPAERLGWTGPPHELVQVDLLREAPGLSLPAHVAETLLDGVDVLSRLVRVEEPADLRRFRDAFRDRYGERRVPLLEALDADAGIGFGREAAPGAPPAEGIPWGPPEQLMLRVIAEAAAAGSREIDIRSAVPSLQERPPAPLPDSFAVLAVLAAASEQAVEAGDYDVRLIGAFGPSGVRLFGRFCHADAALHEHSQAHLRAEEALHPDAVFAEIAHLPDPAVGDIVSRPRVREHEIPLGPGSSGAQRIEPRDLDVALEGERLVLRTGDGHRVMPRLTSAHDVFGDGLALYRFLGQLQFQGTAPGLSFRWGPLAGAPFLPRVRVGRVVLSLARWRIAPGELRALRAGDHLQRVAAVAAWRRRVGCPRFVGLPLDESALPLDLDDPACAETLLREAPPDGHAVVQEWWPEPERCPVTGPDGRYAHELLIPFLSSRAPQRDVRRPRRPARTRRAHPPGSEWLFAKLYTSPVYADDLIARELAPVARAAVAGGAASSWHFIRYSDPEFHLRLRLRGEPGSLSRRALPLVMELGERLMRAGTVRRVALDTYEREIERYGGDSAILLAEEAFHADSDAVATLLEHLPRGEESARERWRLAACGAWSMMRALGLTENEAAALSERLRASFAAEQGVDRSDLRALAKGLRAARPSIEALLDDPPVALRERDARLVPVATALQQLERGNELCRGREEIAGHLVHMHCNRLLRASPRPQELRIHDALVRVAAGRAARRRASEVVR